MHMLMRRYSRSGYASPWFLRALAVAFLALSVLAAVRGDWLVFALALAMVPVALILVPLSRRLADALRASTETVDSKRSARDG
jgi:hypothetical protein